MHALKVTLIVLFFLCIFPIAWIAFDFLAKIVGYSFLEFSQTCVIIYLLTKDNHSPLTEKPKK